MTQVTTTGVNAQPSWSQKYISQPEIEVIEAAIGMAEAQTSGEIVPVLVERSVSLHHVPTLVAGAIAILTACGSVAALLFVRPDISLFDSVELIALNMALAVVIGRFGLARLSWVQRLFTSQQQCLEAAHRRAELEFHRTGIPATHGHTGVMIFVSVFERRAIILGDRAISEKMTEQAWIEITSQMVKRLGTADFKLAFSEAIGAVGVKLAREFPQKSHDNNELPNKLVIH